MADISEKKQCGILNEIEVHVEAIQRLVKGQGQENPVQELQGQIKDDNKSDKFENFSCLSTISQHIDIIHQEITDEKTKLQLSPPSLDQQSAGSPIKGALVVDPSLVDKAINNSLILRTIMQHLATKDLFNGRLVAKKWEEEATSLLLSTRQDIQVKFEWDNEESKFRKKFGTLDEFTDSCYGNPLRKFPCSRFSFENMPTCLELADLFKFFSNHGHHIKSLSLQTLRNSTAALSILRKIVFEWTPNLRSLTILGDFENDGDVENEGPSQEIEHKSKSSSENGLQPCNLSLEHLKLSSDFVDREDSGTAQTWSLFIRDILSSTPNIKAISEEHLWFTKEIYDTGKITAVSHLIWKVHSLLMMPRCIEFSQSRPQLTILELDLISFLTRRPPRNFVPTLLLILQSSRDTLKILKLYGRLDFFDGASQMDIPTMENLQQFVVRMWNCLGSGQGRLLPENVSLQKSFPQLKTLIIDDVGDKEVNGDVDNPFGYSCNSSTTVEELTIGTTAATGYRFEPSWLGQARNLYPNVRILHLEFFRAMDEITDFCRAIWTSWNGCSLEELSICVRAYKNEDCVKFVDQALTSFDQDICRMLKIQRCCRHCHGEKDFERGPSILDMTCLKLFQLNSPDDYPIYSQISVIHAFEPMRKRQNLRVKINGLELQERILENDVKLSDCLEYMDENKCSSRVTKFPEFV